MKSGTYHGIGIERRRLRDWRLAVANIGFLQVLVVLFVGSKTLSTSEFWSTLEVSFVVSLASVVSLLVLRITGSPLGTYALEWTPDPDTPGVVRLSYTTPKGKVRTGLQVNKVTPRPNKPLYMPGQTRYRPAIAVEGTEASVVIDFKNQPRFSLALGFLDRQEMNAFCDQFP